MLAPFPMGLRATAKPRPAMQPPRISSPALSTFTDSDDGLSVLEISDLPPLSDKPTYSYYEPPAPPRPPRNPERLKEYVPYQHRDRHPPPPCPPPSSSLPPLPSSTGTPPQPHLFLSTEQNQRQLHILTHPYSPSQAQPVVDSGIPALSHFLTPKEPPYPSLSRFPPSQPLPSPPTTPVTASYPRLRSTTVPAHFGHSSPDPPGPNSHPHPNRVHTMYPTPGGLAPWGVHSRPVYSHTHSTDSGSTICERGRESTQTNHQSSHPPLSSNTLSRGHLQQPSDNVPTQHSPVVVPVSRTGSSVPVRSGSLPLSLFMNGGPRAQALPMTASPRSTYSVMDSDSDGPLPPRDHHAALPSDAGVFLNVHGGLDTSSRLHPFETNKVPYPRSYERAILDLDSVDTRLIREMSGGSLTWHMFPPSWNVYMPGALKKVLDIGCGDGTWVIEAAKCWRGCEVVGLDIVSIHPNLEHVPRGDREIARRVTWVQANFLEGLPFDNDMFDFVHVKRIARGIPQNKWEQLFGEITRVMKPGAAFEVVEEDLSFPEHDGSRAIALPNRGCTASTMDTGICDLSTSSMRSPLPESRRSSALESTSSTSGSADSAIIVAPKPESRPSPRSYSQPTAPSSSRPSFSINVQPSSSKSSINAKHPATPTPTPIDIPVTNSPTEMHRANSLRQLSPTSNSPKVPRRPSTATSTTPSTAASITPSTSASTYTPSKSSTPTSTSSIRPPLNQKANAAAMAVLNEPNIAFFPKSKIVTINPPRAQKRAPANIDVLSEPNQSFFLLQNRSGASLDGREKDKGKGKEKESGREKGKMSFFRRTGKSADLPIQAPPAEADQNEGVAMSGNEGGPSQVNGGSLLRANGQAPPHVNEGPSFQADMGVVNGIPHLPQNPRDHAVLEIIYNQMHEERCISLSPLGILENAVELRFVNVRTHPPIVFRFPPSRDMSPHPVHSRKPNTPNSRTSHNGWNAGSANPIISLDGLYNGASPYASLHASTPTETRPHLPNPALNVDLRSLNLHLALRVKEIVGCAEAMWEWVLEFQRRRERHDGEYARILELTRPQFDELVLRFELDMRGHMGFGSVLEDRFNWSVIPGPTPQEKRSFDNACEKWDAYQRLESGGAYAVPHPTTRLSRSLRVFVAWKSIAPYAQS